MHHEWEQGHEARALDGGRELALVPGADAGALARHDLAEGGQVALQIVRIFVADRVDICATERAVSVNDFFRIHIWIGSTKVMMNDELKWNIFETNFFFAHAFVNNRFNNRR